MLSLNLNIVNLAGLSASNPMTPHVFLISFEAATDGTDNAVLYEMVHSKTSLIVGTLLQYISASSFF